jgi:hypothetical protein
LKGSTASTIAYWDHFHTYIIYDFSKLSQIWGYHQKQHHVPYSLAILINGTFFLIMGLPVH